ncbi:hypothetical protein FXO37_14920 [Capsicum annuum]|nr:hypothetical protein FXO37_14920 [Capsicum annuum]
MTLLPGSSCAVVLQPAIGLSLKSKSSFKIQVTLLPARLWLEIIRFDFSMVDNTTTKRVTREVSAIGHKREVTDDALGPNNNVDELVEEFCSSVDLQIIVKHVSRIPRLLNWETADKRPHFETFIEGMLVDVDNPVVYRNIPTTSRELAILQLPSEDAVAHTTSDNVFLDDDFQDAPPTTVKNKGKKKVGVAFSPSYKKQKQVKSAPLPSNISTISSSRKTPTKLTSHATLRKTPPIFISKPSPKKRSLSLVAKHQPKKIVTRKIMPRKIMPRRTLPKQSSILQTKKNCCQAYRFVGVYLKDDLVEMFEVGRASSKDTLSEVVSFEGNCKIAISL